jgi:hypothetical protein
MVHYEETIRRKVAPERIYRHVSPELRQRLESVFRGRPIAVWGSRDSGANRSKFEQMVPGDEILIIEGPTIKLLGKIAVTTVNSDLSHELWQPLRAGKSTPWDLVYFIANPQEIDLAFVNFCRLMGYAENYQLRGFTAVKQDRLERFYGRYDDLYSILMLLKQRRPVYEIPQQDLFGQHVDEVGEADTVLPHEDLEGAVPDEAVSDHLRMQWKLLNLGLKAGSKVWIPASDQSRIRTRYDFDQFEADFAAGLNTQVRYVENIDVVWKEEFRIDAAFEIENSTAIYSGLLRFADLTLIAPNTIYPLFIVAPRDKRNRLIEQLRRPTFQRLRLDQKVRYLPYEAVDEINRFFEGTNRGLTVEVIVERSEDVCLSH